MTRETVSGEKKSWFLNPSIPSVPKKTYIRLFLEILVMVRRQKNCLKELRRNVEFPSATLATKMRFWKYALSVADGGTVARSKTHSSELNFCVLVGSVV